MAWDKGFWNKKKPLIPGQPVTERVVFYVQSCKKTQTCIGIKVGKIKNYLLTRNASHVWHCSLYSGSLLLSLMLASTTVNWSACSSVIFWQICLSASLAGLCPKIVQIILKVKLLCGQVQRMASIKIMMASFDYRFYFRASTLTIMQAIWIVVSIYLPWILNKEMCSFEISELYSTSSNKGSKTGTQTWNAIWMLLDALGAKCANANVGKERSGYVLLQDRR